MAKKRNSDWEGVPVKSKSRALATTNGHATNGHTNGKLTTRNGQLTANAREQIALLQQLTNNTVTSRMAFANWMLDQLHDINRECGYPDSISAAEYKQMYEREGIAARVVSIYPTETWAVEPEIYEDEDVGVTTPFEAAWENLNTRLGMLEKMSRLDELCGIGHYGVLFVGISDGLAYDQPVDGAEQKLYELFMRDKAKEAQRAATNPTSVATKKSTDAKVPTKQGAFQESQQAAAAATRNAFGDIRPHYAGEYESETTDKLPPGTRPAEQVPAKAKKAKPTKTDVLFVIPLDETQASIAELENDPNSWRFGKPKYYNLTFFDPTSYSGMFAVPTGAQTRVHWTRVVHVADNCKSNEIFGQPRQKKVYNRLLDIRKVLGGSAEMQWKTGFPGYAFEVPPEINDQVELDREGLAQEVDLYMNTLKKYMSLQGVQAKVLQGQVNDPSTVIDVQILAICIAIETPKRVFMGTEEAKLASIEDATAWLNRVKSRQNKQVTPRLIRPIIDLFIAVGALPDAPYEVAWKDLHTMSDADKATVAASLTQAIVQYIAGGGDSLIPPLEFLTLILQMDRETAVSVLQAAEQRLIELEGPQLEQQAEQALLDQEKFDQQLEMQQVMTDGLVEGAKKGGVNIPREVLANPANKPPFGGRSNLPIPSNNQQTSNIFCATGEGGGVDPTCTKDDVGTPARPSALQRKIRERAKQIKFSDTPTMPEMRTFSADSDSAIEVFDQLPSDLKDKLWLELDQEVEEKISELLERYHPKVNQEDLLQDAQLHTLGVYRRFQDMLYEQYEKGEDTDIPSLEVLTEHVNKLLGDEKSGLAAMDLVAKLVASEAPQYSEAWDQIRETARFEYAEARDRAEESAREDYERRLHYMLQESLKIQKAKELYDADPQKYGGNLFRDEADRDTWYHKSLSDTYGSGTKGRSQLQTETSSGRLFTVAVHERARTIDEKAYNSATVIFEDNHGSFDATGMGDAHEVFGKVVPAITAYVEHHSPDIIEFSASGESRMNLYNRLVKTVASLSGNHVAAMRTSDDSRYYYIVPRDKQELLPKLSMYTLEPLVNAVGDLEILAPEFDPRWFSPSAWKDDPMLLNTADCGAGEEGAPGFQPGNTCGSKDGISGSASVPRTMKQIHKALWESAQRVAFSDEVAQDPDEGEYDIDIGSLELDTIRDVAGDLGEDAEIEEEVESRLEEWREEEASDYEPDEVEYEELYESLGQDADALNELYTETIENLATDFTEDELNELTTIETDTPGAQGLNDLIAAIPGDSKYDSLREELDSQIAAMEAAADERIEKLREDYVESLKGSRAESDMREELEEMQYRQWARDNSDDVAEALGSNALSDLDENTWYQLGEDGSGSHLLKATTSEGREYVLTSMAMASGTVDITLSDVKSGSVGRRREVGGAQALSLFDKVIPALVAYVSEQEPDVVTFSAAADGQKFVNEELGISREGKSRQNLYNRAVRTAASLLPGYTAAYKDMYGGGTRKYVIVKSDQREKYMSQLTDPDVKLLTNAEHEGQVVWLDATFDPAWFTADAWEAENAFTLAVPEEYVTVDRPALETRNARQLMDTGAWTPPTLLVAAQQERDRKFVNRLDTGVVRNAVVYEEQPTGERKLLAQITNSQLTVLDQAAYQRFLERSRG